MGRGLCVNGEKKEEARGEESRRCIVGSHHNGQMSPGRRNGVVITK